MAVADKYTPTTVLASDSLAARSGFIPTGRGVKLPKQWVPPDFGQGQDEDGSDDTGVAPAPPIPDQARDMWYAAAMPNQAPPYVDPSTPPPVVAAPSPPPVAAPPAAPRAVAPSPPVRPRVAPASSAPPPSTPPLATGGGDATSLPATGPTFQPMLVGATSPRQFTPTSTSSSSMSSPGPSTGPRSTVAVSGAQDVNGNWLQGLARIGQMARQLGFDNDGAQAAMAVARTEGGLFGAEGDISKGGSFGPYQFYVGGQLANFASQNGMSMADAASYATTHPWDAVQWALSGYLGQAIRKGQSLGLHGAELATYAQRYGQVSDSPERAGQWYDLLFSGGLSGAKRALGVGQDVGVGDDWEEDPVVTSQVIPQTYAQDQYTADQANIQNEASFLSQQQPPPTAPPPPPAPVSPAAPEPPNFTARGALAAYNQAGKQAPDQTVAAASQEFAQDQTPESAAANQPDQRITTTVPGMEVPPQGSPLSRSIQGQSLTAPEQLVSGLQGVWNASQSDQGAALASGVPQLLARSANPNAIMDVAQGKQPAEVPVVAGLLASAVDPLSYASEAFKGIATGAKAVFAPAKNLPEPIMRAVENLAAGENGAGMARELWNDRISSVLGKSGTGLNTRDAASLYEAGHPFSAGAAPHPDVVNLSQDMEHFANSTGDEGRLLKYIGGDVRNRAFPGQRYFPHVYEDTVAGAKRAAQGKGLNPLNFYSNERTYPTLQDAVTAGKQPLNSVSEPFGQYAGAVLRSKARAQFIQDLKVAKTAGIDVMRAGGAKAGRHMPEGWVFGGDILPRDPRFNQYWFEPQTAQVLKNITEKASTPQSRAILGVANQFKRSLLGLGTFHLVTEEGQALGAAGPLRAPAMVARSLWNMWGPNFTKFRLDNVGLFQDAADAGVTLGFGGHAADVGGGATSKLGQIAQRAGVSGAIGGAYGYSQAKAQGASDQDAIKSALAWAAGTGVAGGALGGALERAVFNRAIPTLKVMTYALYKDKYAPNAVASFVNRTYGGNNLAAIGRSPQVQNILRGTLLASDWWEGWTRQIGNAFLPGASGDLSRRYWAQMLGASAFTLEGLNMVTGGHPTTDNEPGHQLELEVTNLYDKLGWSRRDPTTGGDMRVYWDILGPLRPLATLAVAAGKALSGQSQALPGIGDQFGPTAAQFASSRLSPWLDVASQQASGKDYFGNPLVPPGMDPAHELAQRITREVGGFEPAPAQQFVQEQRRYGTAAAGVASTLGRRLSYDTPLAEQYQQRDNAITQLGGDLQKVQEAVRQRTTQQFQTQQRIVNLYANPGTQTHAQIDQKEMDLRQQVPPLPDIYSDINGAPISPELQQYLATSVTGTSSSDALADLTPDQQQQIGTLAASYWTPLPADQMASVDPTTQAGVRRQKLQDIATQLGTDPATLLDNFKAQQRGMQVPPLQGVTSAEVEDWVTQWVDAGKSSTDPTERAAARGQVIDRIVADHPGLDPNAIQARINLRLTPAVANVPEAEQSHQNALDALMQQRSAPKYVDANGQPMGSAKDWAQFDQQIRAGEHKKGIVTEYDPSVKPLVDARDRATAAKNQALAKSPAFSDYQRWFGEGRNMTEAQWQSYQADPGQRWKDHPDQKEAQLRVSVMERYDAYTPEQRRTARVIPLLLNGKTQMVPVEEAYKHFKSLEVPNWQSQLSGS